MRVRACRGLFVCVSREHGVSAAGYSVSTGRLRMAR